jgi:hypothetical protein
VALTPLALSVILLGALLGTLLLGTTGAPAAQAGQACPTPATSPDAFVGKVVDVRDAGTLAVVTREDGVTVVVLGAPPGRDTDDRTYQQGATYEFHPRNDASPYDDDACTATRLLRGPEPGERTGRTTPEFIFVGVTMVVAVLAAPRVARRIRRRQRLRGESPDP